MSEANVSYCCTFTDKVSEPDHYERGCEGKRIVVFAESKNITAPTLKELIERLKNEFFVDMSYLFIPDNENGVQFISCNQLETADCNVPTEQEREMWKRGEVTLYLCDYTFRVERRLVSPISLEEFNGLGITIEM